MQANKKEFSLPLPGNLPPVVFTVEKMGQNEARENDNIYVKLTLYLPAEKTEGRLLQEITFGERLEILRNTLEQYWGSWDLAKTSRYRIEIFSAETYREAFDQAESYAVGEVEGLVTKLETRKRALINAEK